jgi:hypothetical protein
VHNYVKNLSPEISDLLETERYWSFDILELEKLTNRRYFYFAEIFKTTTKFLIF